MTRFYIWSGRLAHHAGQVLQAVGFVGIVFALVLLLAGCSSEGKNADTRPTAPPLTATPNDFPPRPTETPATAPTAPTAPTTVPTRPAAACPDSDPAVCDTAIRLQFALLTADGSGFGALVRLQDVSCQTLPSLQDVCAGKQAGETVRGIRTGGFGTNTSVHTLQRLTADVSAFVAAALPGESDSVGTGALRLVAIDTPKSGCTSCRDVLFSEVELVGNQLMREELGLRLVKGADGSWKIEAVTMGYATNLRQLVGGAPSTEFTATPWSPDRGAWTWSEGPWFGAFGKLRAAGSCAQTYHEAAGTPVCLPANTAFQVVGGPKVVGGERWWQARQVFVTAKVDPVWVRESDLPLD